MRYKIVRAALDTSGVERPQAGPLEVRREEGAVACRAEPRSRPRTLLRDPVYDSSLVTQVVNRVMIDGKKSTAEQIVYKALESVGHEDRPDPGRGARAAIKSVTPVLEVRSRRVGGANYQVPIEVPQRRARTLAVRWLVDVLAPAPREARWSRSWPARSWTPPTSRAARSSARTTCTGWRRPTRPSRTTAGKVAAMP